MCGGMRVITTITLTRPHANSRLMCSVESKREVESLGQGLTTGRKLLAQTDERFRYYTGAYPNKNVMVCKKCDGANLQGVTVAGAVDRGFKIFVFDSGIISNRVSCSFSTQARLRSILKAPKAMLYCQMPRTRWSCTKLHKWISII